MQVDRLRQSIDISTSGINTQIRRWNQHGFRPYIVLPICVGIVILSLLLPFLIGTGYTMLGTQALENEEARVAVTYLQQARTWNPSSPNVYHSLAQAHLLLDQPEAAVAALEDAYRLQPDSLLIQQELAQAYEAGESLEQAHVLWETLGVTAEQMVAVGDSYLDQRQYAEATAWYRRASVHNSALEPELGLRRFLAAHLAGSPTAISLLKAARAGEQSLVVYPVRDIVKINGAALRWMMSLEGQYGMPLTYGSSHRSTTNGYLWWTGEAFAVVSVEQDDDYYMHMRVQHRDPSPVELTLGVNNQTVRHILLERGDDSWETIGMKVYLTQGVHTIHISFLNDASVNGKDRNAVIEWLVIEKADGVPNSKNK